MVRLQTHAHAHTVAARRLAHQSQLTKQMSMAAYSKTEEAAVRGCFVVVVVVLAVVVRGDVDDDDDDDDDDIVDPAPHPLTIAPHQPEQGPAKEDPAMMKRRMRAEAEERKSVELQH